MMIMVFCNAGLLEALGWKEDSSGSEDLDPPEGRHYPMDLRLAEARYGFKIFNKPDSHSSSFQMITLKIES